MKSDRQKQKDHLDAIVERARPSQLPVHATRASYQRMLMHCMLQDAGKIKQLWACVATGARVHARMVQMRILDRLTGAQVDYAPVVTLYCSVCDTVPQTHKGDAIFSDEITTLSM